MAYRHHYAGFEAFACSTPARLMLPVCSQLLPSSAATIAPAVIDTPEVFVDWGYTRVQPAATVKSVQA